MSALVISFDGRFKGVVNFNGQKASNTPEWGINHIQTGLFFSSSETKNVKLSIIAEVTATKIFFH